MTDQPAAAVVEFAPAPQARLEPDAIGVAQDTVIGMASAAPTVSIGLTLAALAAVTAYGSGPNIIVVAIPMLIIANAYRRLNLWNANCGASFEWVGRAISPYLGFLTGWLMIAAYITGAIAGVEVIGPSVLAVFGASTAGTGADIAIATAVTAVMLVIAVAGIKITARTQVGMAVVEYVILIGFAITGLIAVLSHHPGTVPITHGWFSLSGIGGHGSAVAGFVIAIFIFSGWEGTVYVNEEVRHRHSNPGRAAIMASALVAAICALALFGLQGVVSPARLQANSTSALVYAAQALGGAGWAKVMALSLALSVIAATGTSIVLCARIVYGMASYRALPRFLANVSPRFATPVAATVLTGVLIIALTLVYLLATSLQNAFSDVVNVSGQLFSIFYILTALAAVAYYRRRVVANPWDALVVGVLPVAAAGFLGWILVKYLLATYQDAATRPQVWSLAGVFGAGLVLLLVARFAWRSPFFQIQRESDTRGPRH